MRVKKEARLELTHVPVPAAAAIGPPGYVRWRPHERARIEHEFLSRAPLPGELDGERLLFVHRDALVPAPDALDERAAHRRVRADEKVDPLFANGVVRERPRVLEERVAHGEVSNETRKARLLHVRRVADQAPHD